MPYFTSDSNEIYYEIKGQGQPLLLLAGLGKDSSHWLSMEDDLLKHYQLILIDNRGAGKSDVPGSEYSVEDMAMDVERLLQMLGYQQIFVLGHSLGGAIAQSLAYQFPKRIKKLVLSHSFSYFSIRSLLVLQCIQGMLEKNDLSKAFIMLQLPWFYSNAFLQKPGLVEIILETSEQYPYQQGPVAFAQQVQAIKNFDSRAWLADIHVKALVIAGEEDYLVPKEQVYEFYQGLPDALYQVFPGAHLPMLETPKLYAKSIIDFLS